MATVFTPVEEIDIFCRFCGKVLPAKLDRGIAGSGKTVDENSTFEYVCTKCLKTFCFSGSDLLAGSASEEASGTSEAGEYAPSGHFRIGEKIYHSSLKEEGTVVGKEPGSVRRILVSFEKSGLKKLVEDIKKK